MQGEDAEANEAVLCSRCSDHGGGGGGGGGDVKGTGTSTSTPYSTRAPYGVIVLRPHFRFSSFLPPPKVGADHTYNHTKVITTF